MIASRRPPLTPPSLYTITLAHSSWAAGWLVGRSLCRSVERSLIVCVTHYMFTLSACYYDNTQTHILYCNDKPFLFFCISIPLWQRLNPFLLLLLAFSVHPSTPQGRCVCQWKWKGIADNGRRIYFSLSPPWPVRSAKKSTRICVLFLWWDFLVGDGLKARPDIYAAVFFMESFGCWRVAFVSSEWLLFLGQILNSFFLNLKNKDDSGEALY